MKLPRRRFLQFAASAAAALSAVLRIAWAQESYPTRPVRLLVGYAAGGPADTIARLMAQWLSERPARSEALPDIAAVAEFVPGYEASNWTGIGAPKATPAEIVEKVNREINAGLADPRMKARLADLGGTVLPGSPSDFGKFIAEETEKWAKVIKFAGAKAD
jgi:tripartite-type tricarboxylate transporter receptor subunit TctC